MTIKNAMNEKTEIRRIANAKIKELQAQMEAVKAWRDEECEKQDVIIAEIRAKREAIAKAKAKKARAEARAKAQAEAKAAKAKMKQSHPDHGGTNEGFRQAHTAWKEAEARASAYG